MNVIRIVLGAAAGAIALRAMDAAESAYADRMQDRFSLAREQFARPYSASQVIAQRLLRYARVTPDQKRIELTAGWLRPMAALASGIAYSELAARQKWLRKALGLPLAALALAFDELAFPALDVTPALNALPAEATWRAVFKRVVFGIVLASACASLVRISRPPA